MATVVRGPAGHPPHLFRPRRSVLLLTHIAAISLALVGANLLPSLRGEHTELTPRGKPPLNRGFTNPTPLALISTLDASIEITGPTYVSRFGQFPVTSGSPISFRIVALPLLGVAYQQDWPNPRGKLPVNVGFTDSFNLPLQALGQSVEIRGPTYVRPLNVGFTDRFKLPLQSNLLPALRGEHTDLPPPRSKLRPLPIQFEWSGIQTRSAAIRRINQYDWPNPRGLGPRPYWTDSFKLQLQALGQSVEIRGPTYVRPLPSSYIGWTQSSTPNLLSPVAVSLPLTTFSKYDWPNPRGAKPVVADWDDSLKLPLQGVKPANLTDWPNPTLSVVRRQDWVQGWALTFLTSVAAPADEVLLRHRPWPNPIQPTRWRPPTHYRYLTTVVAPAEVLPHTTFSQYDWPNPIGLLQRSIIQVGLQKYEDHYTVQDIPALQRWDNPNPPFAKKKKSVSGFTQEALTFKTIVTTTPFYKHLFVNWDNPRGPTYPVSLRTWTDRIRLPELLNKPPKLDDWPVPRGAERKPIDWVVGYPRTIATVVNLKFFPQNDWPNPAGARHNPPDWVVGSPYSLLNTVVVVNKIERTYDWRNPQGARRKPVVADYQNRNQLLLSSTAPLRPFVGQKTIHRSLGISTTGPNLVLSTLIGQDALTTKRNNYDWPNPRGYVPAISLRTFTDSFKLELLTVRPPSIQRDWPNPRGAQWSQFPQGFIGGLTARVIPPGVTSPDLVNPGCAVLGGYFSKGQWHTIIGTPCPPKKRRSWREPGFSYQQYQDFKEAILAGEVPLSQRQVKRWYEGGAFSRAQYDDIKATIRLERETQAQRQKLEAEAKAFAEARAHEDRLAAIEAEAQAAQAQNELQARAGQLEAASKLQSLQNHLRLSEAMAAAARRAKAEDEDDERAIAMLFGDD